MKKLMNQMLNDYDLEFSEHYVYPARYNEDGEQTTPYRLVYNWEITEKSTGKELLTNSFDTEFTAWEQKALMPELLIKERRMNIVLENFWNPIYALIKQRRPILSIKAKAIPISIG